MFASSVLIAALSLSRSTPARAAHVSPARSVHVEGKKAKKIVKLFEAAGALETREGRLVGLVEARCKYPNGPYAEAELSCVVRPRGTAADDVELATGEARRWVALMSAVDAFDDGPEKCGLGSCVLSGHVGLDCAFTPGPNVVTSYACDIRAAPPAEAPPAR